MDVLSCPATKPGISGGESVRDRGIPTTYGNAYSVYPIILGASGLRYHGYPRVLCISGTVVNTLYTLQFSVHRQRRVPWVPAIIRNVLSTLTYQVFLWVSTRGTRRFLALSTVVTLREHRPQQTGLPNEKSNGAHKVRPEHLLVWPASLTPIRTTPSSPFLLTQQAQTTAAPDSAQSER